MSQDPASGGSAPGLAARLRTLAGRWRNTLFSGADQLWLTLLWVVSTPVFLTTLGTERFGVWILINAVVGLGGVMSLGFSEATVRYVSRYRALGDTARVRLVIESSLLMYAATGVAFALLIFFGAPWAALAVFNVSPGLEAEVAGALRITAAVILVATFLKTYESAINGFERFDITAKTSMVARSAILLTHVGMALLGFGLPVLLAVLLAGLIGQTLALRYILTARFAPGLGLFALPDRPLLREILSFGLQSWVQISSGALSNLADRFLVGALIGPAAAGVYAVCIQLAQQMHLLMYRGLAFLMPAASGETARADSPDALRLAFQRGVALTLIVVGAIAVPLYILAEDLLNLWLGAEFAANGTDVLRLLVIYFALFSFSIVATFLVNGAGRPGWASSGTLGHGLTIVALAALFLPRLGLEGAGIARLAALPVLLILHWGLHRHVLAGMGLRSYLGGLGTTALMLAAAHWAAGALASYPPLSLPDLIGVGGVLAALGGGLAIVAVWVATRLVRRGL